MGLLSPIRQPSCKNYFIARTENGFDFSSLREKEGSVVADLERANKKNKQGQSCKPLEEVLRNLEIESMRNFAFVSSCNKQNYKNSGCYLKVLFK